jgi:hypothetical protein
LLGNSKLRSTLGFAKLSPSFSQRRISAQKLFRLAHRLLLSFESSVPSTNRCKFCVPRQ